MLNTGRTKCPLLQEGLREISYLTATAQCELKAFHLLSARNRLADSLSRWHLDIGYRLEFEKLTSCMALTECHVTDEYFEFVNDW